MTVKIYHLADIHIGTSIGNRVFVPGSVSLYQSVLDTFRALDKVIDDATRDVPDFVIIAGDVFDRIVNSRVVLTAWTKRLSRLIELSEVIIVTGNHDLAAVPHMLSDHAALPVKNLHIISKPRVLELKSKDGTDVSFACIGWPTTTVTSVNKENKTLHSAISENKQRLHLFANDFAKESIGKMKGQIKIFVGHGTMMQMYSSDDLEKLGKLPTANDNVVFYPAHFERYDYVALGHIHSRRITANMAYPGSLCVTRFNEADWEHGYLFLELDPNNDNQFTVVERNIEIRPYSNVVVDVSKFEDEPGIVEYILRKAPPDKERFVRVRLDNLPDTISPHTIYDIINKHYGFITVAKGKSSELVKNTDIQLSKDEPIIDIIKHYAIRQGMDENVVSKLLIRVRQLGAS